MLLVGLLVVAGYLAGSLPFGYWLVRWFRGADIRKVGSGNIGATNVWRTYGPRLGIAVMLLDTVKGFVPAFVATLWVGSLWGVVAGAAAMLGHSRPVFLKFARGGKMVATCGGAFLGVAPVVGEGQVQLRRAAAQGGGRQGECRDGRHRYQPAQARQRCPEIGYRHIRKLKNDKRCK